MGWVLYGFSLSGLGMMAWLGGSHGRNRGDFELGKQSEHLLRRAPTLREVRHRVVKQTCE